MFNVLQGAIALFTIVTLAPAGAPQAGAQAASAPGVDVDLVSLLATKGPAVVRCADGLLAFGTGDASAAGSSLTVKKNAVTARLVGDFAAHPNKNELAELTLIAMENVLAQRTPAKLVSGDTTVEVIRLPEPLTCAVVEVISIPFPAEYDKPITYREMNFGGRPIGIINLRYLKKQPKRTSETCTISNLTASINGPLAPALHTAFMEELVKKQQKFFKQVVQSPAAVGEGYELRLHVLGFGAMDGEGDVAFISFRVVDHVIAKVVTYGRGFRQIGTKQEKDVRTFATLVACL